MREIKLDFGARSSWADYSSQVDYSSLCRLLNRSKSTSWRVLPSNRWLGYWFIRSAAGVVDAWACLCCIPAIPPPLLRHRYQQFSRWFKTYDLTHMVYWSNDHILHCIHTGLNIGGKTHAYVHIEGIWKCIMYRVQQGGGQNRPFFAYVIYGWPL